MFIFGNLSGFSKAILFSKEDLIVEKRDTFDLLFLPDCELTEEIGKPQVPIRAQVFPIPKGSKISEVKISEVELETLPGNFLIFPSQKQYPISWQLEKIDFIPPRDEFYQSERIYPGKVWEFIGIGKMGKEKFAEFLFYPIQYLPKEKKVIFYKKIKLSLNFISEEEKEEKEMENGFEYLCITSPPLDTVFERLTSWKEKKGIPSAIRTVSWIENNYPGRDRAEKIRNYLKTLPDSGTKWVLLGGDTDIIPCRYAYAMTCSANIHPREDLLPSDLYYGDLDGDWNFDGDTIFGEVEDSIDLYPELFVGRAPVNTISEAQAFVNKVLNYEKSPNPDYLQDVLFFAEVLWSNPYTDGGVHKDKMERESFSSDFNITKLYQRLGNLSRTAVMNAMRMGKNLLNHDGHGWIDIMSTGGTSLRNQDLDTVTNLGKYGVLYSIGCWTTAYDFDCIAEHYLINPRGGGVGFIGNSSYGWGSPGNPGFGYSDKFDNRFFYELLKNRRNLGEALAYAKIHYLPFSRQKNVYRWHQYQVNLLGDPEIKIWTKRPCSLEVSSPSALPNREGRFLFKVTSSGTPVKDALVCLKKDDESYDRGLTNERGEIFLRASPQTPGNFSLTVTAPNFYPLEREIPVVSGGYVNFLGFLVNDSLGNNDKIPNPNETLFLSPIFKNCGDEIVNNINVYLSISDTLITLLDSFCFIPSLSPGESIMVENGFQIFIGNGNDGHSVNFNLLVRADSVRLYQPTILICRPRVRIHYPEVRNRPSLPNETKKISISLYNSGFGISHRTWVFLSSLDPYLTVLAPESLFYGEIQPKSICSLPDTFLVAISPSCPGSHLALLQVAIRCQDYQFLDTFPLLIGQSGFWDNTETGDSLWQTGGTNNLWHLSSRRSHSGSFSWYCGDEQTTRYHDNMNAFLQTLPFMVDQNPYLKFWRWFKVPNYGVDGIYVIIIRGNRAETLDFIGTGGALGDPWLRPEVRGKVIESDWCQEFYDLSFLSIGETIQVRFVFKSDNDGQTSEGFYLDDFEVGSLPTREPCLIGEKGTLPHHAIWVFPNPVRKGLNIQLDLPLKSSFHQLVIYDAKGSKVKRISLNRHGSAFWDKRDEKGKIVSPGLYFLFLNEEASPKLYFLKKLILID
ncbi:MAG: C25 family cysteine peptidase [candidate division WOR-3 bacterium]